MLAMLQWSCFVASNKRWWLDTAAPRWVYALSNECETGSEQARAVSECVQVT